MRLIGGSYAEWSPIVGVVRDIRQRDRGGPEPDAVVYVPIRALPGRTVTLMVRSPANAAAVTPQIRDELRIVEPDLPVYNIGTLDEWLSDSRWTTTQAGTFRFRVSGVSWPTTGVPGGTPR